MGVHSRVARWESPSHSPCHRAPCQHLAITSPGILSPPDAAGSSHSLTFPGETERCITILHIPSCSINPLPDALIFFNFFFNSLSPACRDGIKFAFCWLKPCDYGEGEGGGRALPALCWPHQGSMAAKSSSIMRRSRTSSQPISGLQETGQNRTWWDFTLSQPA